MVYLVGGKERRRKKNYANRELITGLILIFFGPFIFLPV
jgi:hypothetical protein